MSASWNLFKSNFSAAISTPVLGVLDELNDVLKALNSTDQKPFLVNGKPVHMVNGKLAPITAPGLSDVKDYLAGYDRDQASKRTADSYFASLAGSPEAMQSEISAKKKRLADDEAILSNPKDVDPATLEKTKQAAPGLRTAINSLEASLKRTRETASFFERLHEQVTQEARNPGLNREGFAKLDGTRERDSSRARNPQDTADTNKAFLQDSTKYVSELLAREQDSAGKKLRESAEKLDKEREKLFESYTKENDKLTEQLALLDIDSADKLEKIFASSEKGALTLQRQRVLGFAKLQSLGESPATAQREGAFQINAVSEDADGRAKELNALIAKLSAQSDQAFEVTKKIRDLKIEKLSVTTKAEEDIAKLRLDTELIPRPDLRVLRHRRP